MQVKVCGIRTPDGARAAAAARVDFVGLNFVPGTRRALSPAAARALVTLLGDSVPVGVFRNAGAEEIRRVADDVGLKHVQLHGHESPDLCAALRGTFSVVKAVDADQARDPSFLRAFVNRIDILLVDGRTPGSGTPWAWTRLPAVREVLPGVALWLAGGLSPDNVGEAVAAVAPDGDTASGIERDRHVAPDRVAAFTRAARAAATPEGRP